MYPFVMSRRKKDVGALFVVGFCFFRLYPFLIGSNISSYSSIIIGNKKALFLCVLFVYIIVTKSIYVFSFLLLNRKYLFFSSTNFFHSPQRHTKKTMKRNRGTKNAQKTAGVLGRESRDPFRPIIIIKIVPFI